MYEILLNAVSAGGASAIHYNQDFLYRENVMVQVDISDTATVDVEGRIGSDFAWTVLTSFTDAAGSDVGIVVAYPEMRFNVSSYTGGTITAGIAG